VTVEGVSTDAPDPLPSVLPYLQFKRNAMSNNPYIAHLQQKGYTEREIRQSMTPAPREVPAHQQDHFSTYEEYQDAIGEMLNGM